MFKILAVNKSKKNNVSGVVLKENFSGSANIRFE